MRCLALGLALALAACSGAAPAQDEGRRAQGQAGVLEIEPRALATRLEAGEAIQLIDVRTPEEFAEGHLAGALNVPLDRFDPAALPDAKGAARVLYCRTGRRSAIAGERLAQASGQDAVHLAGGITAWQAAGYPTRK